MSKYTDIKLVVVGDGSVGKTCLLIKYVNNTFNPEYVPTICENHSMKIDINGKDINLLLWDTAGQEDYDRLRPLSYPRTNIFLVCFAINSLTSFANIKHKWIPELRHHASNVPYVLVGLKTDIRRSHPNESDKHVSRAEAQKLASEIGAQAYFECSAMVDSYESIRDIFIQATTIGIGNKTDKKRQTKKCIIL